jgi:Fe-S cluster biogenesis protein NfuA
MSVAINQALYDRVEASLDTVRPYLQKDGGNIELVDITPDMDVLVRLVGACETCPMSFMTMKAGVEANLRSAIPEIRSINTVDEAAGPAGKSPSAKAQNLPG